MSEALFHVERRRLADLIADLLMSKIADGTYQPGDRLPAEPELMRQFRVGRSSIREAIGALSLVGLVTVRPGQGTHVSHFSDRDPIKPIGLLGLGREKVRELVEARIELECVIVRLAAERASEEDLAKIREKHYHLAKALEHNDSPIKHDFAFHLSIAQACGNSVLLKFLLEMRQPISLWMEQKAKFDWGYDKVYEQHQVILTAIESRDALQAEAAVKAHLQSTGERLVTAILSGTTDYQRP